MSTIVPGMGDDDLRAVIYVSGVLADRVAAECALYCQQQGWLVGSYIQADTKDDRWADAVALLLSGEADVLVVADRDQLPPNRLPRMVVIHDERDRRKRDGFRPHQRRPQRIADPT